MAQAFVRTISRRVAHHARSRRLALLALSASGVALPSVAWAQCSASGSTVTCTGTAASYTNTSSGLMATVNSGASVAAPLVLSGSGNKLNVAGTVTGSGAYADIQMGANASVTVNGTVSSTGSTSGAAGISVGNNSSVYDYGSLTAVAGTPAAKFGLAGTFDLESSATAAVTGDLVFGSTAAYTTGSSTSTFINSNVYCANTTTNCGLTGNVIAYGNMAVKNDGYWTGNFTQISYANTGSVTFENTKNGTFAGVFTSEDATTLTNDNGGTMTLSAGSTIGKSGTVSSFANSGTLNIGTTTLPAQVIINGSFTQASAGTLNMAIVPSGSTTATAGTSYSQIYATGTSGTINLNGTLNLVLGSGYYATGTTYQLLLADEGITLGSSFKLTGNTLPFVSFCATNNGTSCASSSNVVYTVSGTQQAYEVMAVHTSDYAASLATAGIAASANQIAVARGLNPLVALANATPSGNEGSFLGYVDVSSAADVPFLLDSMSPQGYYAYAIGLRDQANAFERNVALRLQDQNSNHDEDGWWMSAQGQFHFGGSTGYNTASKLVGTTFGYDFSGPHHVYGLALNISWDALHYAPNTLSGHNRDIAVGAYSGWNLGPLHLTGQVQYNLGHLGANKTLVFYNSTGSPTDVTSTATAGEHLFDANATAGFDLRTGSLLIEPFVGIDMMRGQINSFTENNASLPAAQLTVDAMSVNRTDMLAGLEVSRARGVFRPYLRAVYRSEITSAGSGVTAYFDGLSSDPFTVLANAEAKGEFDGNAGINWVFDDAGSLFVGYQNTIRNGLHAHGINAGIRIEF